MGRHPKGVTMWHKRSKYNAGKVVVNGNTYDSKKEAKRGMELEMLERNGEISNLRRQVKYVLIPAQREPDTIGPKGGVKKGKVIEQEVAYIADFVYEQNGTTVVEDVKGYREGGAYRIFAIKRKLMLWVNHIRIKEV